MPVRTAKTKTVTTPNVRMQGNQIPHTFMVRMYKNIATLQNTWAVSFKFINGITRRRSNCTLRHSSQKMKIYFHTEIWTGMFISNLFVTTEMKKEPNDLQ